MGRPALQINLPVMSQSDWETVSWENMQCNAKAEERQRRKDQILQRLVHY